MFNKKKDNKAALRHNSTLTWQEKTRNQPRLQKIRASLFSTKSKLTSGQGNIYEAVVLPELDEEEEYEFQQLPPVEQDENRIHFINEWVAENLVDFFHDLNMMYNIVTLHNTEWDEITQIPEKLPNKGFPPNVKYFWKLAADQPPQEVSVQEYVLRVLEWIEHQVLDESIFPTDGDVGFKKDFVKRHAKKIFQRMFRIFAIMLVNPILSGIGRVEDENTQHIKGLFQRFMCFAWHWDLVAEREATCIPEFIIPLKRRYKRAKTEHEENYEG